MITRVKESEERLDVIWNNIQTAIALFDDETNIIVNINPKASEIIG
jgi:PAS domain S-box-containing protein